MFFKQNRPYEKWQNISLLFPFDRPVDHLDKLSTAHQGMTEFPCSDLSTRSQSMTDKDVAGGNTIAISSISVLSSHGYNNEVYNSANSAARQHSTCTRPLKQLVVMTGKVLNKLINIAPW